VWQLFYTIGGKFGNENCSLREKVQFQRQIVDAITVRYNFYAWLRTVDDYVLDRSMPQVWPGTLCYAVKWRYGVTIINAVAYVSSGACVKENTDGGAENAGVNAGAITDGKP